MKPEKVGKITDTTRQYLWAISAGRCELEGCNEIVYKDWLTQTKGNFGQVAHIIGHKEGGPRGDKDLSNDPNYVNNIDNLMLMCPTHHTNIDTNIPQYSPENLRRMKKTHEERILSQTENGPNKQSYLVIYLSKVGRDTTAISFNEAAQAITPDYYPAKSTAIELGVRNDPSHDHDPDYWEKELRHLERQFNDLVKPIVQEDPHFSLFAFAPMPLLIKFGTLFYAQKVRIYPRHKDSRSLRWDIPPRQFGYQIIEPTTTGKQIALKLSLSADITDERVHNALSSTDVAIWELKSEAIDFPMNDHLRSEAQLELFSKQMRILFNQIKAKHGEQAKIHLFPAAPIAACIALGRSRQPKADLPLLIYDQSIDMGGFYPTIEIN